MRRQGSRAFYVRGHLLSWHLGGPGNDWRNLSPLYQNANQDHEQRFESKVKGAVEGARQVENLTVQAVYGRPRSGHIDTLRDETSDSLPAGLDPGQDPFKIADLLEAETHVPVAFDCSAQVMESNGEKKSIQSNIPNDIDYAALSHYSLTARSRVDFNLTTEVNRASDRAGALTNLRVLDGVGPRRATRIYERVKDGKRITDYYAQINISKKTLEKRNPTRRIKQG